MGKIWVKYSEFRGGGFKKGKLCWSVEYNKYGS